MDMSPSQYKKMNKLHERAEKIGKPAFRKEITEKAHSKALEGMKGGISSKRQKEHNNIRTDAIADKWYKHLKNN